MKKVNFFNGGLVTLLAHSRSIPNVTLRENINKDLYIYTLKNYPASNFYGIFRDA